LEVFQNAFRSAFVAIDDLAMKLFHFIPTKSVPIPNLKQFLSRFTYSTDNLQQSITPTRDCCQDSTGGLP